MMECRVSSIHRPSTPEKEVNGKENTAGKIANRQLESLRMLGYRFQRSSMLLRNV